MSDAVKHECGIALIRLLKPLDFFRKKYGTFFYGLNKLCLLMEKQHNRGQDGAGIANIKFDVAPGSRHIALERSAGANPIKEIFLKVTREINETIQANDANAANPDWLKKNVRFSGELYLGHLRYGTFGKNNINSCHPVIRENNWMTRNLVVAGNFNLTNVDMLFNTLLDIGQHPIEYSDTVTVLEKIGHFLDEENDELVRKYKEQGYGKKEISPLIAENLDILKIIKDSCKKWDGGYTIAGLIGHGDAFALRDPSGIRPAYYYYDDEIAVVTSERPPIQTAFNVPAEQIRELRPGHVLIIKKNGDIRECPFTEPKEKKACSFERIYFSRGTDCDIYRERKLLGKHLVPAILRETDGDMENTVFSFIPNTAEICFMGMTDELRRYCAETQRQKILAAKGNISPAMLEKISHFSPRIEKLAVKDAKLRTFITDDAHRNELAAHVYDITYGVVKPEKDTIVVVDDSIVRGTTMRESIIRILDRTSPRKIIIVSSAPQIRYPDCYGIDMAKLGDFVAFQAAIALLRESGMEQVIDQVRREVLAQMLLPATEMQNCVKQIYHPFTAQQLSSKIATLLKPADIRAEIVFIYQTIEDLHRACPNHLGDWYFTGNYPTPGGNKVANQAFLNYIDGNNTRPY